MERLKIQSAGEERRQGVRHINEILPLVLARYATIQDQSDRPIAGANRSTRRKRRRLARHQRVAAT